MTDTKPRAGNARLMDTMREAIEVWRGWMPFRPKTADALGRMGYFEKRYNPYYGGDVWHITESGIAAYETMKGGGNA